MRLVSAMLLLATALSPQALGAQGRSVLTLLDVEGRMLTVGDTVAGELTASDFTLASGQPAQAWGLSGQAGVPVTIDVTSEDFDAYVYVVGPAIETPYSDDDGGGGCNARVSFRPRQDGLFRVVISAVGSSYGSFRVGASRAPGNAMAGGCEGFDQVPFLRSLPTDNRNLTPGDSVDGQLVEGDRRNESGVFVQAWSLQLIGNNPITVDLVSDDFDSYLYVIGPGISGALTDDDSGGACHARVAVEPTEDGEYTVIVSAIGAEAAGEFRLSASSMPRPPSSAGCLGSEGMEPLDDLPIDGRMLRLDAEHSGELHESDREYSDGTYVQAWGLELVAGQSATADLISSDFDAYLYVAGPGLTEMLRDDDGAGGCHARISFVAPTSGMYRVVAGSVSPGATGTFALRISSTEGPPVESGTCLDVGNDVVLDNLPVDDRRLEFDQPASGFLDDNDTPYTDGSYLEAWGLTLEAGQDVTIDLRSQAFDAYLYVTGPGLGLMTDDDSAGGCDARVVFRAPQSGVYRVVAGSLIPDQFGQFTILVGTTAEPPSSKECSPL